MKSSTNHVTHPWRYLSCCMRPHTAQSVHCGYQLPAVWPLCRGTGDHCHTESKYCRNIELAVSGVLSLPGYHDTSHLTTSQLSRTWFVKLEPDNNTFARVVLPLGITPRASSELTNILYLLALVILLLFLIGWHNHRRKLTFIIYLLLAVTLSISPLIGMWEQSSSLCEWARCDHSWCWLKTRYLSLPTERGAPHVTNPWGT